MYDNIYSDSDSASEYTTRTTIEQDMYKERFLDLGDLLPERLALDGSDLELERGGLAGSVSAGESTGAPGGT